MGARDKLESIRADYKKLVGFVNLKFKQAANAIEDLKQIVVDHAEEVGGHLREFGDQLWGIHVIQEVICKEVGLDFEEVKKIRDERRAAIDEQQRLLKERGTEGHEKAQAEKLRQREEKKAEATATDGGSSEAPTQGLKLDGHGG